MHETEAISLFNKCYRLFCVFFSLYFTPFSRVVKPFVVKKCYLFSLFLLPNKSDLRVLFIYFVSSEFWAS